MPVTRGNLELILGPMFSGKTTELIRRLADARRGGERVLAIKPASDDRYSAAALVSHAGDALPATSIADAAELARACGAATVVGIDEVHFFDASALCDVVAGLLARGTRIIAAGVDLDHRGEPFDTVAGLRPMAGPVTLLTARCAGCGGVAQYTQRLVPGDDRIVVGGAGDYEPRCERCFRREAGA